MLTATEQLLHATVMIRCWNANGQQSSGTGFLFGFFPDGDKHFLAVVSNKHVIAGAGKGMLRWTLSTSDDRPDFGKFADVEIHNFENSWILHPDPAVDLAILPCGLFIQALRDQGKPPFIISLVPQLIPTTEQLKELTPLEDVLIIGYPDGIADTKNNVPVFRRGITATPAYLDFSGRKEFLIDAAIFPGSSGSPVILLNQGSYPARDGGLVVGGRLFLLGIVYAVAVHATSGEIVIIPAPTQARPVAISQIPNNLGICIESSRVLEFEPLLVERGFKPPEGYVMRASGR